MSVREVLGHLLELYEFEVVARLDFGRHRRNGDLDRTLISIWPSSIGTRSSIRASPNDLFPGGVMHFKTLLPSAAKWTSISEENTAKWKPAKVSGNRRCTWPADASGRASQSCVRPPGVGQRHLARLARGLLNLTGQFPDLRACIYSDISLRWIVAYSVPTEDRRSAQLGEQMRLSWHDTCS